MNRTMRNNANRESSERSGYAPEQAGRVSGQATRPAKNPSFSKGENNAGHNGNGRKTGKGNGFPRIFKKQDRATDANVHDACTSGTPSHTKKGGARGAGKRATRGQKPHKPNFVMRAINQWCNRLLGAVSDKTLSGQEEEYSAHMTKRDYVCNTIGTAASGMLFPLLTVVVTQLSGVELAGMFSLAFVTGSLLMIVANYGVRTFQVSDLEERYSFADYQANRWITCAIMVVVGIAYCTIRGYAGSMFLISLGIYLFKMVDGLADVYEGRLQQVDKLYLAGISQAFRSVAVLVVFSLFLLITRNLPGACIAMAVTAAATFLFLTLPLALFESRKSPRCSMRSVGDLFKQCFPLFVALFLYTLIDSMPKFVMEGVLSYDNQLYFNALYFPAQAIFVTIGLIYKPLIIRMAEMWNDPEKRRRFDLSIVVIMAVIVAFTLVMVVIMEWIGLPVMNFMYGVDFEQFRGLCYIMLAAGGVTAAIDFLYQVITVLRRQKDVTRLYLITFGFSLFVPILLVNFTGLPGAVIGYLIVMCILLVLLVSEYIGIRKDFAQQDKPREEESAHLRPSEVRAERERRDMVHAKWETGERTQDGEEGQNRA